MLLYLGLLLIFFILIWLIPIKVDIHYQRHEANDFFRFRISAIRRWIGITMEIPMADFKAMCLKPILKVSGELETGSGRSVIGERGNIDFTELDYAQIYKLLKQIWRKLVKYRPTIYKFLGGLQVQELKWRTEFGLGDPALTGMATGMMWSFKGWVYSTLMRVTRGQKQKPRVKVVPRFDRTGLGVDLDCIIGFRFGHIMVTGINFMYIYLGRGRE